MMLQRPFVEETETFSLPVRLKARMNLNFMEDYVKCRISMYQERLKATEDLNFAEDIIKKSVFMISSCTI